MFIENRIKKKSRNEQIIEKDLLDQKDFNGLSVNWVTKNYRSSNKAKIVKVFSKREDDNLINYLRDSSKRKLKNSKNQGNWKFKLRRA